MKQTIALESNGDVSVTWEAETDAEGVDLKETLLDAFGWRRTDDADGGES